MTDPLDDLKRALDRTTPEPDGERRTATLTRAMELFDRARESAAESVRTDDRLGAWAAFRHEVRHLLAALTSRPVVAAAAGLVAVGLGVLFVFLGRDTTSRPEVLISRADGQANEHELPPQEPSVDEPQVQELAQSAGVPPPARDEVVVAESLAPELEPGVAQPSREVPVPKTVESEAPTVREEARPADPPTVNSRQGDHESFISALNAERERLAAEFAALSDSADGSGVEGGRVLVQERTPPPPQRAPTQLRDFESYQRERRGEIMARIEENMAALERANRQPAGVAESAVEAGAITVVAESALVSSFAPSGRSLRDIAVRRRPNTEAFANEDASPLKIASEEPVSTFSIDVDTVSYSVLRSSLTNGYLPSPESVRIEELINYFPYAYPPPGERGAPFRPTVTVSETPWNPDTLLMQIGIQGRQPATDDRPPLNLVFLIDTSGSMDQPNKLPLLVQSFRLLLGQLRPEDEVGIVTYAGSVNRVLDATPATERSTILNGLDRLRAAGSTAGAAGIQMAYGTAAGMAAEGEVTRVILATDGDFNVGISDPEQLEDFIARQRESGIYLSVLGFGRGNLDDATMQALAQNGNGQAAYIDTLAEARKVLVDQLTGTLFPIADDVKIQVEFNPAVVGEYRLIGYETRALRREDFNNDRVDAGEIGAGHAVTAIYEVTPVGSPAVLHDALRYSDRSAEPPVVAGRPGRSEELAFLRLRYKEPGEDTSRLIELPIARDAGDAGSDQSFAAAIAGFGQLLRGGVYTGGWSFADAIALAEANTGIDRFGYRREVVTLMRLAESLAE